MREFVITLALSFVVHSASAQVTAPPAVPFEEAIRIALEKNPGVAEAAQAILRAEAFLQQARTVYRPSLSGSVTTTVLDNERGFEQFVTQPQVQSFFSASLSYPVIAASRWAARAQAEDQVRVARLSVTDVRRQVAVATAQAYLAIIAQQRQVDVNLRARENAQAHVDYAQARLQGGAGSKLNELRASQELATIEVLLEAAQLAERRAQEALGVLLAADGPIDAAGEPTFAVPADLPDSGSGGADKSASAQPSDQPAAPQPSWMLDRPDVQLFSAQVQAADRVFRDSWKDWVPSATAAFEPQLLAPSGLFQPARTWRGFVSMSVPILDAGSRRATRREREVALQTTRIQLTDVQLRARAELRTARASLESTERALEKARLAAQHAADVLRITDVAFRAGATTNLELVDAQRRARDADTAAAQAEDRVRQARLDLLVALGRFPQ
jgi:outer membrane protein